MDESVGIAISGSTLFSSLIGLILFMLGVYVNSIRDRITRLEAKAVSGSLCDQRHLLDEERIKNLLIALDKSEERGNADHSELKKSLIDITSTISDVKDMVHNLAKDVEKRKLTQVKQSDQ